MCVQWITYSKSSLVHNTCHLANAAVKTKHIHIIVVVVVPIIITFCVSRRRRKMYCVTRVCVSVNERFSCLLNPNADNFCAWPAASCLLDPSLAAALLTPDRTALCEAAKKFIIAEVCTLLNVTAIRGCSRRCCCCWQWLRAVLYRV